MQSKNIPIKPTFLDKINFISFKQQTMWIIFKEIKGFYYLSVVGLRENRFTPFLRVLALCEMQTASCSIWIVVADNISTIVSKVCLEVKLLCREIRSK